MQTYSIKKCSLEYLWKHYDFEFVFSCQRTLQSYHTKLCNQLQPLIKVLAGHCAILDSAIILPAILPDEQNIYDRLKLLFKLLDMLVEIIHRKNIHSFILQEERTGFLHAFVYQKSGLFFFDSS